MLSVLMTHIEQLYPIQKKNPKTDRRMGVVEQHELGRPKWISVQ